jgi:succinate dehydrogenase / fumarate reductase cytochrome b subunit
VDCLVFTTQQWYKFLQAEDHERMSTRHSPPVYLNLFRIRFPVGAVTSIGHRISGVLLFLSLPLLVWLLDLSLRDADGYRQAVALLHTTSLKLLSVPIAWSLLHHLCSGIRFLLIDTGAGVQLKAARTSAWLVNITALAMTLVYLVGVL